MISPSFTAFTKEIDANETMINEEMARPDSEKVGDKEAIGSGGEGSEEEMGAGEPVMEELMARSAEGTRR